MEKSISDKKELMVFFTKEGFTVDYEVSNKKVSSEENRVVQEGWHTRLVEDKYKAVWDFGFIVKDQWMSPTISFLYYITITIKIPCS